MKGVLRGDDAARAIDCGAAGVVVSNHGGRQLDTAAATIRVLPEIVEAIAGRGTVLIDGGVRRGTDVLKALTLGASMAMVGRPVLWGLAVGGEAGARRVLTLLREEFDNAMALCGITDDNGGRTEIVRDAGDLSGATGRIADELTKQYYLGYASTGEKDGKWHSIRVEVRSRNVTVRARKGYVAS